ncbi:MAG: hypothetical protein IPJ38_11780 [Dechloromonas sp.]|uniref:Uncharacterized protein n=1 Tax=Candidatus Dechloromonas phosphorivorans TaxID=2899244 RepID=A0A935MWC8_9RHOO|nr:hypothetical protein [Candidatus Dechloromonas phosphorivorans]
MGEALLQFDKDAEKWLCSRFKVERAHANIFRKHELQSAIRNGDFAKVAREVAQIRQEIGECGRSWQNDDETTYSAGWADFQAFRTNV